jgi:hypothetical protein
MMCQSCAARLTLYHEQTITRNEIEQRCVVCLIFVWSRVRCCIFFSAKPKAGGGGAKIHVRGGRDTPAHESYKKCEVNSSYAFCESMLDVALCEACFMQRMM